MSDASNPDLVAAINGLTAEIKALRESLSGLQSGVAAPPPAAAAPAPAVAAPEPEKAPFAEVPTLERTESERVWDQIDAVLAGLFLAVSDDDDDAGFEAFLDLMHTDRTDAPRSIPSLKEFTWKSLKKNRSKYLGEDGDASDFSVARRVPETITEAEQNAKVFLASPNRSPVPISFRRDADQDDAWKITDSSL